MILAFLFGFSGAIISMTILTRIVVGIVAKFKSGELYFQSPIGNSRREFVSWEFETVYHGKTGTQFLGIIIETDKGIVELPTHSIEEWSDFLSPFTKSKKAGQKNNSSNGKTGKKSKNNFIGKGKTISQNDSVLIIQPTQDLYPNMKLKLSDGTIAQIVGIQAKGQDVQKAKSGEHVGIELDVEAIAGAIHKA